MVKNRKPLKWQSFCTFKRSCFTLAWIVPIVHEHVGRQRTADLRFNSDLLFSAVECDVNGFWGIIKL